jgi:DNA-binding GntR family transcriptional regulator
VCWRCEPDGGALEGREIDAAIEAAARHHLPRWRPDRRIAQALARGDVEKAERFAVNHHEGTALFLLRAVERGKRGAASAQGPEDRKGGGRRER